VPDALTFKIAKHAVIVVTPSSVVYRWCDYEGRLHRENIGRTSLGHLLAKQLNAQKARQCAGDGTPYPYGFFIWTNGQRLCWLHEHRETVITSFVSPKNLTCGRENLARVELPRTLTTWFCTCGNEWNTFDGRRRGDLPAFTSGLPPSAFLVADGRRIRIGMSSDKIHTSIRD
jgi:hypothetical protein